MNIDISPEGPDMTKAPRKQPAKNRRQDIATYVMARSDSMIVNKLAMVLLNPSPGREVRLLSGDSYITSLIRDFLKGRGIAALEDVDCATRPSDASLTVIAVPRYVDPDGPGRVAFNDTWDRPLIVAQAVGEALRSWPDTMELKLGSGWLWLLMSYRKWRDIDNLREFVSWSLDLARAKGWCYVDESDVFAEFDKSGQLESLFTVDADLDMAYFPPYEQQSPVSRSRCKHRDGSLPFPFLADSLLELIKFHWDCYATCALDEIALRHHDPGPRESDMYIGYPILPNDTLPFLRNLEWWERQIGEKEKDDLSELDQPDFGRVQVYCRGRWSANSDRELAKSLKTTVPQMRQWKYEMHLETEFGGRDDGYEQWLRARREHGIGDLVILNDFTKFAIDGEWVELGGTKTEALKEIHKAGSRGLSWTESRIHSGSTYTGYPKLFHFTNPPGKLLRLLLTATKSHGKTRYRIKPCVNIVSSAPEE